MTSEQPTHPKVKWTEATVLDALREFYLPASNPLKTEEWAFLTQVPLRAVKAVYADQVASGKVPSYWATNERTIDALLVRNWSGGKHGHERIAIEVKVSKADYRNETDEKRSPAEASAHRCAYAAPAGLIDPADLPPGWGLIEVHATPTAHGARFEAKWIVRAKRREPTASLDYLVSAGFRRASRAEERIRRGESAAAELVALRAEQESLRAALVRAHESRDREIARAKEARNELLAINGTECSTCGEPLSWKRGGYHDSRWFHKSRAADEPCRVLRQARYREALLTDPYADFEQYPTPTASA